MRCLDPVTRARPLIDRLERVGYAHRLRRPQDRRGILIELTPAVGCPNDPVLGDRAGPEQARLRQSLRLDAGHGHAPRIRYIGD
jgi:hypothetical protein